MLINPKERAKYVAELVNKGNKRRCHKFRCANYYGGISTVDVLGCNLSCVFCWVGENKKDEKNWSNWNFLSPEKTSDILIRQAIKNNLQKIRLSGGEPLINPKHTLEVMERTINEGYGYVFETNGTLITKNLMKKLIKFKDYIYVYYGLKGITPKKLSEITNADPSTFDLQLKNMKLLIDNGFTVGINLIANFVKPQELEQFIKLIQEKVNYIAPLCIDLKRATLFPHICNRIRMRKVPMFKPKKVHETWETTLNGTYGMKLQSLLSEYCLKETNECIRKYKVAVRRVIWFDNMKFLPFGEVFNTWEKLGFRNEFENEGSSHRQLP